MVATSGQGGGTAADYAADIDQLFMQYEGRHATADELSQLGNQLAGGSRSLAAVRADLVGSSEGQTYLGSAISQVYQQWGGRAATPAEVAVWSNEMTLRGATLATVRAAVLTDPLGATYTTAQVTQAYQSTLGRAPSVGEIAAWQDRFLAGFAQPTTASVAAALQSGSAAATIDAQVTQAYRDWGGRDPTAGELATWRDTIVNHGGTLARLKADIVADPLGTAYIATKVTEAYQQWGGRAPTVAELSTWHDTIANGGSLTQLKADIIADPLGTNHLNDQVTQAYQQWMGRAPTSAELATWHGTFAAGGSLDQLRGDLLADAGVATYQAGQLAALFASNGWNAPSAAETAALLAGLRAGQSFADAVAAVPHEVPGSTTPVVTPTPVTVTPPPAPGIASAVLAHVYDSYAAALGRAPTAAEATAAAANVQADGTGADTLRGSLLAGSEGQGYVAAQVTATFQQLLGRAPSASELADATGGITNGGTYDQVRAGILDSAEGHAQAATFAINQMYHRVFERDATPGEIQDGVNGLSSGQSVAGRDQGLFNSADGFVHFGDTLAALYQEMMGQGPTSDQYWSWYGTMSVGGSYDTMRATLMLDPASLATHLTGTLGADSFALGSSPGDVVVSAFDPTQDRLVLGTAFAGTNLLDAAHASQVMSLDGVTPNVLIRLDDHDTILLHGVTLAQLSANDFLFA